MNTLVRGFDTPDATSDEEDGIICADWKKKIV